MAEKIPMAAQKEIIRLQRQVLRLEERIAGLKEKHAKEIAKLKQQPKLVVTPEQLEQIRQLRGAPESPGGR
jgi:hypothetical protein